MSDVPVDVTPVKNAWTEPGYNCVGFDDEDFDKNNFKRKGPYVDFRYKLNQDTIKGDLAIRRKVTAKQEAKDMRFNNVSNKVRAIKAIKVVLAKAEPKLETIDQLFNQYTHKTKNKNGLKQ